MGTQAEYENEKEHYELAQEGRFCDTPRTEEAIRIGGIWQPVMIEFARQLERELSACTSMLDIHVRRLRAAETLLGEITAECNWSLVKADGTPTKFYQRVMDFLQPNHVIGRDHP